ncbi:carboxypeptidase B-like [Drosophila ficusphila]|uniref:carboxypeptidase B-like n=1 Tax=Drosophila ficusphila TaxID=30025 RepID=UPI0007E6F0A7|nr:carboxypeptidase B-like [Drosophila ficusphila]
MYLPFFLITLFLSGSLGISILRRPEYQTDDYYTYEEIQEYLKGLEKSYSKRVRLTDIGRSYENRKLTTITITNGDGRKDKNAIFIDAGIHAREWLTHTTALNVINELVVNFEENKELLKEYDWIVLPLVNPDGYTFTRSGEKFTNETIVCNEDQGVKCWRKNRQPNDGNCIGTDLNRNFAKGWSKGDASNDPCYLLFMGTSPFSAPESKAVGKEILKMANYKRGIMYLSFHSAAGKILYPWGFDSNVSENVEEHREVGRAAVDAIAKSNFKLPSNYSVVPAHELYSDEIVLSGGSSSDFAYEVGFPLSYTWELPGKSLDLEFMFHPPTHLIKELVEETWIGLRAMAKKVIQLYPVKHS